MVRVPARRMLLRLPVAMPGAAAQSPCHSVLHMNGCHSPRPTTLTCSTLGIPLVPWAELEAAAAAGPGGGGGGGGGLASQADLVIDALFGFSFSGAPRAPFDAIIKVGVGRVCSPGRMRA